MKCEGREEELTSVKSEENGRRIFGRRLGRAPGRRRRQSFLPVRRGDRAGDWAELGEAERLSWVKLSLAQPSPDSWGPYVLGWWGLPCKNGYQHQCITVCVILTQKICILVKFDPSINLCVILTQKIKITYIPSHHFPLIIQPLKSTLGVIDILEWPRASLRRFLSWHFSSWYVSIGLHPGYSDMHMHKFGFKVKFQSGMHKFGF